MIGWGISILVIGAGSFILPMMGLQFRIMKPLESSQPIAGIVVALVGAALIAMGVKNRDD